MLHSHIGCTWIPKNTLNTSTPCHDTGLRESKTRVDDYAYTTLNPTLSALHPIYATTPKNPLMMNSTVTALSRIASLPVSLIGSIPRPNISYVPAAHVKLKAEHIVMVFICVLRQICMYVEGWRDSRRRRNRAEEENAEDKRRAKKRSKKRRALGQTGRRTGEGRRVRIVMKGRYTLMFQ